MFQENKWDLMMSGSASLAVISFINKKCFRNIYAPLLQNLKLLLICTRHGCNPCTKFGIDQVKGSKDIEQTPHWARKSGLTLTFEHVNTIGVIYLLRATPAPSLVLIKWRGQQILSGQHLVYSPTDRPTYQPTYRLTDRQLQNNIKIGSHLF